MSAKRLLTALVVVTALVFAWPAVPQAQRGGHPAPPHGGARVAVGVGWGYGPWGPYGGWGYGWGPWGPYGPWGGWGWGGPCCYYDYMFGSARIDIDPQQAEVFVDGYRAGIVDDFDNPLQRLNVWPGEHEITLFLEGYKTQRHLLHMARGTTAHLKGTMEKLAAGEKSEPPPAPAPPPEDKRAAKRARVQQKAQEEPARAQETPAAPARFGNVSIKVQPADAVIAIDDQVWTGPTGDLRLTIQLSAGRHHIEVRKDGYVTYAEDVLIRADATLTLNVNLSRK